MLLSLDYWLLVGPTSALGTRVIQYLLMLGDLDCTVVLLQYGRILLVSMGLQSPQFGRGTNFTESQYILLGLESKY